MKMIFFTTLIVSLLTVFSTRVSLLRATTKYGGFSKSCYSISVQGRNNLKALCKDHNSRIIESSVDLNKCIGNIEGKLTAQSGGYTQSTRNCAFKRGSILFCECRTSQGKYKRSNINLNSLVGNINGILKC
jgi:hypothetical protein